MKYLTVEQVLFIHSRVIRETGGSSGVRDFGLLKSAVARPQASSDGEDLYPTLSGKAAALFESLARNHPFLDGNKRTAISSTGVFLQINFHKLTATNDELFRMTLAVAQGECTLEAISEWIEENSYSISNSER